MGIRPNGHNFFLPKNKKTVHLQGFWPKSVYLKRFGTQLKTVYLQGPHSLRPCISRPCCTAQIITEQNLVETHICQVERRV